MDCRSSPPPPRLRSLRFCVDERSVALCVVGRAALGANDSWLVSFVVALMILGSSRLLSLSCCCAQPQVLIGTLPSCASARHAHTRRRIAGTAPGITPQQQVSNKNHRPAQQRRDKQAAPPLLTLVAPCPSGARRMRTSRARRSHRTVCLSFDASLDGPLAGPGGLGCTD